MTRLQQALAQIDFARRYTLRLLAEVPDEEWHVQPREGITHVAWQAGHLAMAEHALALVRLRGDRADDETLIPEEFRRRFGRGSVPDPNPAGQPTPAELRAVMQRVHERVVGELANYADADLDLPPHKPHPLFDTRLASLAWCGHHEMTHAGQIGLLRRLMGKAPLW